VWVVFLVSLEEKKIFSGLNFILFLVTLFSREGMGKVLEVIQIKKRTFRENRVVPSRPTDKHKIKKDFAKVF
jgi:hypothetical protein